MSFGKIFLKKVCLLEKFPFPFEKKNLKKTQKYLKKNPCPLNKFTTFWKKKNHVLLKGNKFQNIYFLWKIIFKKSMSFDKKSTYFEKNILKIHVLLKKSSSFEKIFKNSWLSEKNPFPFIKIFKNSMSFEKNTRPFIKIFKIFLSVFKGCKKHLRQNSGFSHFVPTFVSFSNHFQYF